MNAKMLENKVAVVTGSGRGIGEAIARTLAAWGAKVVISDMDPVTCKNVTDDLNAKGFEAKSMVMNVADFAHVHENIQQMKALFGRIDIWVNNAGIAPNQRIEDITEKDWDLVQNIDLKAAFFCSKEVFTIMKSQGYGKMVFIASMAGERGGHSSSAGYSSAKAGVINLAKSFALQGGAFGITSNAICPGRTLTAMAKNLSWSTNPADDPKNTIPLQRFADPQDIANAVLFFSSDLSSYITGATLDVNGGLFIH